MKATINKTDNLYGKIEIYSQKDLDILKQILILANERLSHPMDHEIDIKETIQKLYKEIL
jgi:hypothetical protein